MARDILRWSVVGGTAIALAAFTAAGQTDASPRGNEPDPLRHAFDLSIAACYATRADQSLRACLAGVMDAHLQALTAREASPVSPGAEIRAQPRSDV